MLNLRERREELEEVLVCDLGVRAKNSKGRLKDDDVDDIRTCFQRDIDRISHAKSFRRLKHKTQVFLNPEGDHYRTRLTHTLEVSRIARTISRALMLNEDLTEAIALGHDLGHTPFGHAGERALREIYSEGFHHYQQSLRTVDILEKEGRGLNLTYETRMGILNHTHGSANDSLEATVVRFSDRIAYMNHDVDDAIRGGIITTEDLPFAVLQYIGDSHSVRINSILTDLLENSRDGKIAYSENMAMAVNTFHNFMYDAVYKNPLAKGEEQKVEGIIRGIWDYYVKFPKQLPSDYKYIIANEGIERAVCDYISGMTDDYCMYQYGKIYVPAAWNIK